MARHPPCFSWRAAGTGVFFPNATSASAGLLPSNSALLPPWLPGMQQHAIAGAGPPWERPLIHGVRQLGAFSSLRAGAPWARAPLPMDGALISPAAHGVPVHGAPVIFPVLPSAARRPQLLSPMAQQQTSMAVHLLQTSAPAPISNPSSLFSVEHAGFSTKCPAAVAGPPAFSLATVASTSSSNLPCCALHRRCSLGVR
jgi:hypothetical protein